MTPSVRAKICGLRTPDTVRAAVEGGAGFAGFMMFDRSPRNIVPRDAARLALPIRGRLRIVAVTVDPSDALVDEIASELRPDLIQLHGRETPTRVREVAARSGAGVIKVISVSGPEDLEGVSVYADVAEHLMFDTKLPSASDRPGGAGARFDWSILSGRRFARPWFVAGGLDPWNVAEAMRVTGAPLVDVSSGVERGPGLKDPALIRAFLEQVGRA
ncbi:MAG: phosphoribosylanthranilate isomerase [Caulobacteraceae bacterium]|nr:phosphoribosylanthranilate isomerase [Caulobacteraceae bacterium]